MKFIVRVDLWVAKQRRPLGSAVFIFIVVVAFVLLVIKIVFVVIAVVGWILWVVRMPSAGHVETIRMAGQLVFSASRSTGRAGRLLCVFVRNHVALRHRQGRRESISIGGVLEHELVALGRGLGQLVNDSLVETSGLRIQGVD